MTRRPSGLIYVGLILSWVTVSIVLFRWSQSDEVVPFLDTAIAAESHGADPHGAESHADDAAADDAHAAAVPGEEHGEGHDDHGGVPHLPSFLDLIIGAIPGGASSTVGHYLTLFKPTIFGLLIAVFLAVVFQAATRNMSYIPGKLQNVMEAIIGTLGNFLGELLGEDGKRFIPFCGTLFVYIWCMNFAGLVPLLHASTSHVEMTAALALCVFIYVQYTAFRMNGVKGVVYHLAGEPKDVTGWVLVPLLLPLHIIGELAKPFSLAVRLFGNITGEDTLIAVFVTIGAGALAFLPIPLGLPLQVPFVFLALLLGTIQALVFSLLAAIYFSMAMPHGHEEH